MISKDNLFFYIILIIAFSVIINLFTSDNIEKYQSINILDRDSDYRVLIVLKKMLKDIDGILNRFRIRYWADGATLLGAVRHGGLIPWDNNADICILKNDEEQFLSIINFFRESGYGVVRFWGGYKIYPFNGIDIKHYNRIWHPSETTIDVADREYYNYKLPYINVYVCNIHPGNPDIVVYTNKRVRRVFAGYHHRTIDLFPLRRYNFSGFYIYGPNNPKPYLNRVYRNRSGYIGYRTFDRESLRYDPVTKFKVNPTVD